MIHVGYFSSKFAPYADLIYQLGEITLALRATLA